MDGGNTRAAEHAQANRTREGCDVCRSVEFYSMCFDDLGVQCQLRFWAASKMTKPIEEIAICPKSKLPKIKADTVQLYKDANEWAFDTAIQILLQSRCTPTVQSPVTTA